jgi:hypothetical protein
MISWIRIRISLQMASQNVVNMSLFEQLFKVFEPLIGRCGIRIRIRIKVKGRIRIRIKVTSRFRISIKLIHNTVCNITASNLQMHLHGIYFAYTNDNASTVVMQYAVCEWRSTVCSGTTMHTPPSVCLSVCLYVCLSLSVCLQTFTREDPAVYHTSCLSRIPEEIKKRRQGKTSSFEQKPATKVICGGEEGKGFLLNISIFSFKNQGFGSVFI